MGNVSRNKSHAVLFSALLVTAATLILFPLPGKSGTAGDTDDVIVDKENGLIWQRSTEDNVDHSGAIAYCDGLNAAGRADWRLPSKNELLVAFKSKILPYHEGYSQGKTFIHWSSTATRTGYVNVVFRNRNTTYGVLERETTWTPGGATIGVRCLSDTK